MRLVGQLLLIFCWFLQNPCLGSDNIQDPLLGAGLSDAGPRHLVFDQKLPDDMGDFPLVANSRSPGTVRQEDSAFHQKLDNLFILERQQHAQSTAKREKVLRVVGGLVGCFPPQLICGIFIFRCGDSFHVPTPDSAGSNAIVAMISAFLTVAYVAQGMELMSALISSWGREKFSDLLYEANGYHRFANFLVAGSKVTKSIFWLIKALGIEKDFSTFFWITAPPFLILDAAMNYNLSRPGINNFFNKRVYSDDEEAVRKKLRLLAKIDEAKAQCSVASTVEVTRLLEIVDRPSLEGSRTARLLEGKAEAASQSSCRSSLNTLGKFLALPGSLLIWQWICESKVPVGVDWFLASLATVISFAGNREWLFDPSVTTILPCGASYIYSIAQPIALVATIVTAGVWGSLQAYMSQQTYEKYQCPGVAPLVAIPVILEFSKALTVFHGVTNDSLKKLTYSCQPPTIREKGRLANIFCSMKEIAERLQGHVVDKILNMITIPVYG